MAFLFVGTIGYHFIEGFDLIDSIYMTAVILSTVGFGGGLEELSQIGRLFTIILIILGVGTVAYAVTIMAEYVFENRLFRSRKMERIIENIKDHYIVCGYGRMGKIICRELEKNKKSFIVLDSRPEKVNTATTKGYLALMGDCLEDNFLKRAQLQDAKGLVVVLSSDENNLFVTLSARRMKQDLFIIAKTSHENNATKFLTAGANKVLNPYEIAGHSMANMLTRPAVTDFLEIINEGLVADWEMDEVKVCEGSALHNKQIKEAFVRSELDVIIAAIQKPDGKMIFNPSGEMVIEQNDLLIAMGYNENLKILEEYCQKCDKVTK
ncbi:MAG: potassium channel protein [Candidatus Marinimicrobia bacterium]|nr:potassium channel protein [Candidatus Neomarinimicrobiota bacterium]